MWQVNMRPQRHGPGRVRGVPQILREVSRGPCTALIIVIISIGIEVWCREELRPATCTRVLFFCNAPEGRHCFCQGHGAGGRGFQGRRKVLRWQMWQNVMCWVCVWKISSSPSQWRSFPVPTGPMRRVTWRNVRHTGTHARSSFPVLIPCLSAFYWLCPINCLMQFHFMLWKHWIFQIKIVKVFIAAYKHFTVMAHIWIS